MNLVAKLGCIALSVFLCGILVPAHSCRAADNEGLQRDVETLKQQVQDLEKKLDESKAKPEEASQAEEDEDGVKIGGALRYNFAFRDFSGANEDKHGDLGFDIFRLNLDGQYNDVLISAEYRWYSYQNVIHHGWVGYNFSDTWQGQLGVTKVPFGLLPYASHNWWAPLPYYIGFEDDYDLGVKAIWHPDNWNLQLAFFKNGEWGNSSKLERYSYDVVSSTQANEETNQVNVRLAYLFDHGDFGSSEVGVSGQWGQLYNDTTGDFGDMWAAAVHLNGNYGPCNLMLEAISYNYDPANPAGVSDDTIEIGAFGVSSLVASQAEIYVAGLSYGVPVGWGPVTKLTFYNDYSVMVKNKDYPNSQINTTGCMISANPVYVYVDYIQGKNAQFLGGGSNPYGAATDSDGNWHSRFNINVGYYF